MATVSTNMHLLKIVMQPVFKKVRYMLAALQQSNSTTRVLPSRKPQQGDGELWR